MEETQIGTVRHFFSRPMVAAVAIDEGTLAVGEALHFLGDTTDLYHRVDSMEIDHRDVADAAAGDVVGIRLAARVRERDRVFKVAEAGP